MTQNKSVFKFLNNSLCFQIVQRRTRQILCCQCLPSPRIPAQYRHRVQGFEARKSSSG